MRGQLGLIGAGIGRLDLAGAPAPQVDLPARVEAQVEQAEIPREAGDAADRQLAVAAEHCLAAGRRNLRLRSARAAHGVARGSRFGQPRLGLAERRAGGQRLVDQRIEQRIVERFPPAVLGRFARSSLADPLAGDARLGRLVIRADRAGGQRRHGKESSGGAQPGTSGHEDYSIRARNSQAAALNVMQAMTASGHVWAKITPAGMALRNRPWTTIRK